MASHLISSLDTSKIIHHIFKNDQAEKLENLISTKKIDLHSRILLNNSSSTLLFLGAKYNAFDCCHYLVSQGVDLNATEKGRFASEVALENGHSKLGEELLLAGAKKYFDNSLENDLSVVKKSKNIMNIAALNDLPKVIDFLAQNKVTVNFKSVFDYTPLHFAAGSNGVLALEKLIQLGANPKSLDQKKRTPLQLALELNAKKTLDYLTNLEQIKTTKGVLPNKIKDLKILTR